MFTKIHSLIQEYENFKKLIQIQINNASPSEITVLAQKIEQYDKDFREKLNLYIEEAYSKAAILVNKNNDEQIQQIRNKLLNSK